MTRQEVRDDIWRLALEAWPPYTPLPDEDSVRAFRSLLRLWLSLDSRATQRD